MFERQHNERAWLAWHIAALGRAKKIPKLHTLLAKPNERPRQTWQQQMAIMDKLAFIMNANVEQSKEH